MKPRAQSPTIPGNTSDRTGTGGMQRRAIAEIRRRFAGLTAEVLAIFGRIPRLAVNEDDFGRALYQFTPEQMAATSLALSEALDRWIASRRDPAASFWFAAYQAEAQQAGAAQSASNLARLSAAYAAQRTLQDIVFSEPYRTRAALVYTRSLDHWTSLTGTMKSELTDIIARAVIDGKNPRAVRKDIMARLGVNETRAYSYAQTEITNVLRDARMAEKQEAEDELGLKLGLLWTSALLPATRPWHASRNGKVYTEPQVREFYSQRGNKYNCYLPGTLVSGRFVAGVKSNYEGPAVTLVTAGGRQLSVTANHPVVSNGRLVAAAEVSEGDDLIAYGGQVGCPPRVGELDRSLMGARVEDVFGALVNVGHVFTARVSAVDFHGDSRFMQPNVDVVWAKRPLVFALDATGAEFLENFKFVLPNAAGLAVGALDGLINADSAAFGCPVSGSDMASPGGSIEPSHPGPLGIAAVAHGMPKLFEGENDSAAINARPGGNAQDGFARNVIGQQRGADALPLRAPPFRKPKASTVEGVHNGSVAQADAARDVLQRFAGLAALDKVVEVRRFQYSGHVFDLQELSGLMLGSNILASNCHCGLTECLIDEDGQPVLSDRARETFKRERENWERTRKPR